MSRLVEDVLYAWRHAERLLVELPAVDPDHETVRLTIDRLRSIYQELTVLRGRSEESLISSSDTLARAQLLLERIEERAAEPRESRAMYGRALEVGERRPG